jgi:hypothetical protein
MGAALLGGLGLLVAFLVWRAGGRELVRRDLTTTTTTGVTPTTVMPFAGKPTYLPSGFYAPRGPGMLVKGSPSNVTSLGLYRRGTLQQVTGAMVILEWSQPFPSELTTPKPGDQTVSVRGHTAVLRAGPPGWLTVAWQESPNLLVVINASALPAGELLATAWGVR